MPTLLTYALTTDPFPLQASPQSGNANLAVLTLVATNATSSGVTLQGVLVMLPIGGGAAQLTTDTADIGPVPPPGWKLAGTQFPKDAVQYDFQPTGDGTVASQQSLVFTFNDIKLNQQPGTCEVVVMEGSNNCQPPDCPTATLYLTKFPAGWGTVAFWVDPPIIPAGGATTLNWTGPAGATYLIEYYTQQTGVVNVPAQGQPPLANEGQYPAQGQPPLQLEQNTTLYLLVSEAIGKQTYSAQQSVSVTVEQPAPQITSFTGQVEQSGGQPVLVLNWETTHADYCQLTGIATELTPASPPGGYQIPATAAAPLLMSYTLTAINGVGEAEKRLAAAWTEQPISGSQSWLGDANAVSLSPDGKYALVTLNGSDSLVMLALTDESVSVANSITANNPSAAVFSPDGTVFYVLTSYDNCVQAYSAATYQPIGSPVAVSTDPNQQVSALAVSGGARPRVFVASSDVARADLAGIVSIFDPSLAALGHVPVGGAPQNMVASPDGQRLYVTCRADNTVWTLNLTSTPVSALSHMSVGNAPVGIGMTPDGALVVVACFDDNTVWVLDAQQTPMTLIGSPVRVTGPLLVALSGYRAFVTNWTPSNPDPLTVTIIDLAASQPVVSDTISIPTVLSGTYPDIAVTNAGLLLLVTASPFMVLGLQQYQVAGTPA